MIDEVGLLPYSERLDRLGLTTLVERRLRGDLIEVFKAKQGISKINGVFKFGRSGNNLISSLNVNDSGRISKLKRNFINDRIKDYWNKLPLDVKNSSSVNCFKSSLERFKLKSLDLGIIDGHFWEVSYQVLDKIEGCDYIRNKNEHNLYLKRNPYVARKKGINITGS